MKEIKKLTDEFNITAAAFPIWHHFPPLSPAALFIVVMTPLLMFTINESWCGTVLKKGGDRCLPAMWWRGGMAGASLVVVVVMGVQSSHAVSVL